MTNREAILRLSRDSGDGPAMTSLRDNNVEILHATITRYFGAGPVAEKAEGALVVRVASRARSYEHQENPDEWLLNCANIECDRMRNEAIHDKANID